ncbi:protein-tyrosine phosphatase [Hokovirus HKV1]|uniref:Protein-tyrosine phosphatase n=1 Tax=Hokovirus HKV1 TaxID=1977638 RepID=A0A1V0SEX2_9VIRU|nr:protein-tyrosine phosphatase [Hokovirus HKV1]
MFKNCPNLRYPFNLPFDSNYITINNIAMNASIIPIKNNTHIATEAPMPLNFSNFWDMVFEYDIKCIIMLTKLVENKKIKAHRYWPSKYNIVKYKNIKVSCIKENIISDYLIESHLIIENTKTNNTKAIIHLYFTGWPDFNVPKSEDFKTLFKYCDNNTLVHCSAGIGRTGILLTLLYLFNNFDGKNFLNNDEKKDNTFKQIENKIIENINQAIKYLKLQRNFSFNDLQLKFITECYKKHVIKFIII